MPAGARLVDRGVVWVMVCALAAAMGEAGCRREGADHPEPTPAPRPLGLIEFPEELRADEPAVNAFLYSAFQTCADGEYEAFRRLWSVREDPVSEEEFVRGWRAAPRVSIKDLRKMRTPEGEIVYVVRALVELDGEMVVEPVRDVVFLVVKESERWCVATAPRSVAKVLKGDGGAATGQGTTTAPTDGSTP